MFNFCRKNQDAASYKAGFHNGGGGGRGPFLGVGRDATKKGQEVMVMSCFLDARS